MSEKHVDWAELASRLGCGCSGSSDLGKQALSEILGEPLIKEAIDYYIGGGMGTELARSALTHINPRSGMDYCYSIYKNNPDIDRRRMAVNLLTALSDKSALKWVPEFLNDPDESIQNWGAGIVDQLLFKEFIDEEDCVDELAMMDTHQGPGVIHTRKLIDDFLRDRNSDDEE